MELLDLFIRQLASKGGPASKNTIKNYIADVRHFINWYEKSMKSKFEAKFVTAEIILLYKKSMGAPLDGEGIDISSKLSVSSMKRHLSSLRKFFGIICQEGLVEYNPFDNLENKVDVSPTDFWHLRSFADYLIENKASKITIRNYISDIQGFAKWYEQAILPGVESPLTSTGGFYLITQDVLNEYKTRLIDIQNAAPRTINRKLSALRKYIDFAEKKGFISAHELYLSPVEVSDSRKLRASEPTIALAEIKTEDDELVKKYSAFPPFRLIQALLIFPYLAFEIKAANIIASIIAGKPVEGLQKLPSNLRKELADKNFLRTQNFNASQILGVSGIQKSFYEPHKVSLLGQPLHKKIIHHARFTRPSWYHKYHNYAFVHYAHFALLILFASGVGVALYNNLVGQSQRQASAAPTAPPRVLSFQGRLTDNLDNPITTPTDIRFLIYNDSSASGGALLWQEVQYLIQPDQDGIFSVLLGTATVIDPTVFSDNSSTYLGVSISQTAELTPRQRIASVAYATNSEFLQGLPPITSLAAADPKINTVLALDSAGNLTIGGDTNPAPIFQATDGQFTLSGDVLLLKTVTGTNSNVVITPDGLGKIDLTKALVNTTLNGNLSPGGVEINDKFAILATESAVAAFLINNDTTGGDIFSASSSGTPRFTIANDGQISDSFYSTDGGIIYTSGGIFNQTTAGSGGQCLQSAGGLTPTWGACGSGGNWNISDGAIYPNNETLDLLVGGTSTATAKFRVLNMNTGTPVASVSANSGNNATFISGDGTLGTTNRQTLTIGNSSTYNTTGNILFNPNGIGNVGFYTSTPRASFDVRGISGTQVAASISANTTAPALLVDNSGTGDFFAASKGGQIYFRMNANSGNYGGTDYDGEFIVGKNGNGKITALIVDPVIVSNQKTSGVQSLMLHTSGSTNADFIFQNISTELARLTQAGQLGLAITGSTGGLTIGGDTHIYRGDTNRLDLATGDSFNIVNGSLLTGGVVRIDASGNGTFGTLSVTSCTGCLNASNSPFQILDGAIVPLITSTDFLIGSQATTSAKFAILNMNGGTPIASVSGNLIAMPYNGAGGRVGIGTETPFVNLHILDVDNDANLNIETQGSNTAANLNLYSTNNLFGQISHYVSGTKQWTLGNNADIAAGGFGIYTTENNLNRLAVLAGGNIGIGTVSPDSLLHVSGGNSGGNSALIVNQTGDSSNDILSASSSGTTRFTIANNGNLVGTGTLTGITGLTSSGTITFSGFTGANDGGVIYANSSGVLSQTGAGSGSQCLLGGTTPTWGSCGAGGANSPFYELSGAIVPINITNDFLLGSISTTSAKFAVLNVNSGTPVASVSSGLSGYGTYITADGTLATTRRQTLTVGDTNTGNINIGTDTTVTRTINIGTGASLANNINVGGTGANVIAIGNTQTGGSISMGATMTTGTITIGGTGAQTGTIGIGTGTGAQTINLGTGGTGAKTIAIGTGAVANPITIGNTTGATSLNFDTGTGGINFGDNANTKTIDIGGVTNSGTDTINIATNNSAADVITIGNNHSSTTLALTGGNDWNIDASGNINMGGILQVGSATGTTYSRLGTGTTGHSLSGAEDLLVSGDLEVDGTAWFDGNVTIAGTCTGCGGVTTTNSPFYAGAGFIAQNNTTLDFLLGSISTTSAKFAVLNVNSGTPVASVSSGLSGYGTYITADGTLATTRRQTLTVGDTNTGNINIGTDTTVTRTINIGTGASLANNINVGGTGANVIAIGNTQTGGSISMGATMTTGTITIGGAVAQTGTIILGQSTGTNTVRVGDGTGTTTIQIGTGATNPKTLTFGNTGVATTFGFNTGVSTTTGFTLTANSLSSGTGMNLTSSGTITTGGEVLSVVGNSATTGRLIDLSATGIISGQAIQLAMGTALTTGSGIVVSGAVYDGTTTTESSLASLSFSSARDNTSGNSIVNGLSLASTVNTSGATGTKSINPINIAAPTLTGCTGGSCTWNGILATTATSGFLSTITQNGLNITATGVSAGTLRGINISNITGGAGTENALIIGSGWDNQIVGNGWSVDGSGAISVASCTGCGGGSGSSNWVLNSTNGTLNPINNTVDLLIGGTATTSAKFAVLNVNSGTPTATVSGNFIVMHDTQTGTGGNLGIGTTNPQYPLHIVTPATTTDVVTLDATSLTAGSALVINGATGTGMTDAVFKLNGSIGNTLGNGFINSTVTVDTSGPSEHGTNLYLSTTNANTTNANTIRGISSVVTDSVGLGNSNYGIHTVVTNSGITSASKTVTGVLSYVENKGATGGTQKTYGGYFNAVGDSGGTSSVHGVYALAYGEGSGNPDNIYGVYGFALGNNSGASSAVGIYGKFDQQSGAGITDGYGGSFLAKLDNSATITNMYGSHNDVWKSDTGTITTAYGTKSIIRNTSATNSIGTAYALHADIDNSGTITTGYGLYIDDLQASTAYGIYQNGVDDINYFASKIGIGDVPNSNTGQLYATRPLTSGVTGKALAIFNQIENQDIFTASSSGLTKFVITNQGRVGIGTAATPINGDLTAQLQVLGSTAHQPAASISANTSAPSLLITNDGTGDLIAASSSGRRKFWVTSNGDVYFTGNLEGVAGDFAEYIKKGDPEEQFESGHLVCAGPTGATKCTTNSSMKIIGVISDNALIKGNGFRAGDPDYILVGLVGQLGIRYEGAVKKGDPLTVSSTPGVATVAKNAGNIIGYALEDAGSTNRVHTVIQNNYFDPGSEFANSLDLLDIVNANGVFNIIKPNGEIFQNINVFSKLLVANIQSGLVETQQIITTNITAVTASISSLSGNTLAFVSGTFNNITSSVSSLGSATASSLAVTTNNITIAGQSLTSYIENIVANYIFSNPQLLTPIASTEQIATNIISPLSDSSAPSLKFHDSKFNIHNSNQVVTWFDSEGNASFSGTLASNKIETNDASISGELAANSANFQTSNSQLLTAGEASVSGTLRANNIIADNINLSSEALAKLEGDLNLNDKLATLAAKIGDSSQDLGVDNQASSSSQTYPQSPSFQLLTSSFGIFEQGITSMGPITASDITAIDTLAVGSNLTISENAINTLGAELAFQSLRQADITFQGGLIRMDTDGNMNIAGNLNLLGAIDAVFGIFSGTVMTPALATSLISPLPGGNLTIKLTQDNASNAARLRVVNNQNQEVLAINDKGDITSSGAATLSKLNFSLVGEAQASTLTEAIATGSAGFATLRAYQPEITIKNPNVTSKSLIYITPFGDTDNKVLYLLRQTPNSEDEDGSFTVGVSGSLPNENIQFNWLIVN